MSQKRRCTHLFSCLTSAGVAALAAGALIAPPASAADDPVLLPAAPRRAAPTAPAPTDQFIVKFKDPAERGAAARARAYGRAAAKLGAPVKDIRATSSGARVLRTDRKLGAGDAAKLLASLRADPAVAYAEPDALLQAMAAEPNDPVFGDQWNLSPGPAGIGVTRAWDVTRGGGEVVAVVDTGITSHIDLQANVLPGYDMIRDPANARDGNGRDSNARDEGDWTDIGQCTEGMPQMASSWHGTHVAGIIAAVAGNSAGIAGIAPQARILPVRVLGPCGGLMSDIADAVVWASGATVAGVPRNATPARVVNLSLGGPGVCPHTLQAAIKTATGRGAVVVTAAGNESEEAAASYPGNCQNVINVAASGPSGALAPYSNFGPAVDVTAPGGDMSPVPGGEPDSGLFGGIWSTANDGDARPTEPGVNIYAAEGTSSAAPHVAGTAALLMAQMGPGATAAAVEARLKGTARPVPGGCPEGCGAGLVDAAAAVPRITMAVAAGDLSGDGRADVLARDNTGVLWLYQGNGRGGWLGRVKAGSGWNGMTAIVGAGDMDGDARNDVLARDTAGVLWLYPGNGRGGWFARVKAGSGWNGMTAVVGPGDMNGDRRADVLARDTAGVLWLYPGNGRGGWLARVKSGSGWNGMTSVTGRGDFNGDARNDVLAMDRAGALWLYKGSGTGGWLGRVQAGSGWN